MNFQDAEKVLQTIRSGDSVEAARSTNRSKVQNMANGVPPLSAEDAKRMGIKVNVNFCEFPRILTRARSQLDSAFTGNKEFFTVKLPLAPVEKRMDWESKITFAINQVLNDSREYLEVHRNRWSSVIMHGIGPMMWTDEDKWLPRFVALNDLRIPTDTTIDFRNLAWFARRVSYTPIELVDEVFNDKKNNHWNKKAISSILKEYKDLNVTDASQGYNWDTDAEKMAELMKQSGGFYGSDAVPVIPLYHFYYQDADPADSKKQKWFMRVVADGPAVKGNQKTEFLWESDKPIASSWNELLHCQFGDLSFEPPFKYHSVRGLGFILLDASFYYNLAQCRLLQHIMDNFNVWLRNKDNSEKAKAGLVEFGNLGVVPPGVEIIPQDQRHQIDSPLLEFGMADIKRTQQEASASYTQNTDTGTQKETTAFETRVKLEQVNAMMGSILGLAFKYESYAYREICRRFARKNSTDPDVKEFREDMLKAGIDPRFLENIKYWEINPVIPIGRGNQTMAQAIIQQLYQIKGDLPPESQTKVVHMYVQTISDAALADDLVPLTQKEPSEASRESAGFFSTLMLGLPIPLWGSHLIEQIDTLMPLLAGVITNITQRDNMATVQEGKGMAAVSTYIEQAIQQLSQDQQQKARVKQYTDGMGRLNNEIKGVIQRGEEKRKSDAKTAEEAANQAELQMIQAKIEADAAAAQQKLQQDQLKAAQAMTQKQIASEAEEQRKNEAARADLQREREKLTAEIEMKRAELAAEIERQNTKTAADIENSRKIATAKAKEPKPQPAGAK